MGLVLRAASAVWISSTRKQSESVRGSAAEVRVASCTGSVLMARDLASSSKNFHT